MANTDWKTEATDWVLRVLYQAGIGVSAGAIAANLDALVDEQFGEESITEALAGLEDENMVRRLDEPEDYYLITDRGRNYVEAELDQQGIGFID